MQKKNQVLGKKKFLEKTSFFLKFLQFLAYFCNQFSFCHKKAKNFSLKKLKTLFLFIRFHVKTKTQNFD